MQTTQPAEDFINAFIRQIHEKNWAAVFELYHDSVKEEIAKIYASNSLHTADFTISYSQNGARRHYEPKP